jgi:hypothetical protein
LLDNRSQLAAAVTSRRMMTEALQPFSWKYGQLLTVTTKQLQQQQQQDRPLPAYSLMQLAPVKLVLSYDIDESAVQQLSRIRHLFSLDACCAPNFPQFASVLQHPAAQGLQQLLLLSTPSAAVINVIGALPQLTSCRIFDDPHPGSTANSLRLVSLLVDHPRLTELQPSGHWRSDAAALQPLQERGSNIRRLHMDCCDLFSAQSLRFDTFFTSPGLAQLHTLSLVYLYAQSRSVEQIRSVFAALRQLHTLRLFYADGIDTLLAHVPAATGLMQLHIWCTTDSVSKVPSASAVMKLHAAMPLLHTLICPLLTVNAQVLPHDVWSQIDRVVVRVAPWKVCLLVGPYERI